MMQAACRGHIARNRNRDRWDAAQQIQKFGRGMVQRRRFERAKYVLRGVVRHFFFVISDLLYIDRQIDTFIFKKKNVGRGDHLQEDDESDQGAVHCGRAQSDEDGNASAA
jgi:hypothetical protein